MEITATALKNGIVKSVWDKPPGPRPLVDAPGGLNGSIEEDLTLEQFEYEPLPTPDSFRFAILKRGSKHEELRCELITRDVTDDSDPTTISWEALSWLWGAYGDFRSILINGKRFQVTRNLFIALNHLRYADVDRVLWVDALCINQYDVEERSAQIKRMAFLYHKASRVIAWVGEGNPGSDIVIKLARYLHDFENGNLASCDENVMYILGLTFGTPAVKADLTNALFQYWNVHKFENWSHIDRMVDRELFRRSWVLQEGALAKELIVTCGTETISWDAFFRAVGFRYSHGSRAAGASTVSEGWSAMQAIASLRHLVATRQRPPDLLELLWACRSYRSTDPRDRIFALLGVSNLLYGAEPKDQLGFEIDYNRSTEDIFKSFTISMIKKCRDLRVLATRRRGRGFDDKGLGSWCPDWANLDDGVSLLYRQRQWFGPVIHYGTPYKTIPHEPIKDIRSSEDCLMLRGVKVDKIGAVRYNSIFMDDDARLLDWHLWALNEWPHNRDWTKTTRPRSLFESQRKDAFWRTLIADADLNGNRDPVYLHAQFQTWLRKAVGATGGSQDRIEPDEFKDYLARVRQVTKGRCLFETEKYGYLGIGDEDHSSEQGGPQLGSGDVIAVLAGGPLPVMLREDESASEKLGKPAYKLIGDAFCYVHGLADGQAMRLGLQEEEFTIV